MLPGLINAHAHLFSDGKPLPSISAPAPIERLFYAVLHGPIGRKILRSRTRSNVLTQLHTGVTTMRSLGDFGDEVLTVRDEVNQGKTVGPTILASGPLLAATGGHGAPVIALVADDPWGARANTRRNTSMGVDVIKIAATGGVTDARSIGEAGRAQLTTEEMAAICEEAHNAGKVVAAHAQGEVGLMAALRAGVDTIEHGCHLSEEAIELFHNNPKALQGRSFLVPTLCAAPPFAELDQSRTGVSDVVKGNGEEIFQGMVDGLAGAIAHDVPLGIGNDSAMTYVTHYDFWRELEHFPEVDAALDALFEQLRSTRAAS